MSSQGSFRVGKDDDSTGKVSAFLRSMGEMNGTGPAARSALKSIK